MIILQGTLKNSGLVTKNRREGDKEIQQTKLKVIVESETPAKIQGEMSDIDMHTFFFDTDQQKRCPERGKPISIVVRPYSMKGDFGVSYSAVEIYAPVK